MKIRTQTVERLRDALLASGTRPSSVVSSACATLARAGLLSPEEQMAVTRVDAAAETMFLMVAADAQVAKSEVAALRGAIRGLTGDLLNDGVIEVMLENYAERLRKEGREARLKEIAEAISDPGEAECAFSLAAAIALADDEVAQSERELLEELAGWFGFDQERARTILGQLHQDEEG